MQQSIYCAPQQRVPSERVFMPVGDVVAPLSCSILGACRRVGVPFIKGRTTNHKLPEEAGWWVNIPRTDRIRPLCNDDVVGDEYHYLYQCMFFSKKQDVNIYRSFIL